MTPTLKKLWLHSFDWLEFFHQDLHRTTFFPQKWVTFLKSFVVSSIYLFCAALTENVAVRLCFLFTSRFNYSQTSAFGIFGFFDSVIEMHFSKKLPAG